MRIEKPGENPYVKSLVFSPAGHGKTCFLGSASEDDRTYPMLLLDFEGGSDVLEGLDIDIVHCRKWEDFNEAYEGLRSGKVKKIDGRRIDFGEYLSVGVDSLSEIHRFALLEILGKRGRGDPDLLEQQDYNKAATQMRRLIRKFRDLPLHVFFAAHAKDIDERRVGKVKIPDLSGQMAEEAPALMRVVGYLGLFNDEDGEEERTLLLNWPGYRVKCRTRWGVKGPDEIIAPTVSKLLDVLDIQ